MSGPVRVFVNGRGVDVPAEGCVLDAVRAYDPEAAAAVEGGRRAIADSRGLPAAPDERVYAGAIFRLVAGRRREGEPGA